MLFGMPQLIDPDTPQSARTRTGFDGLDYELVFSDEFNVEGRTFYPGTHMALAFSSSLHSLVWKAMIRSGKRSTSGTELLVMLSGTTQHRSLPRMVLS